MTQQDLSKAQISYSVQSTEFYEVHSRLNLTSVTMADMALKSSVSLW